MASSKSQPPSRSTTRQSAQQPDKEWPTNRSYWTSSEHVFLLLFAFRIGNALAIRTFFQPDEYYQSLEPAWRLAFGADSGAWITWEWRNQLRSSLHPILFAGIYHAAAMLSNLCKLSPTRRAAVLLAAPKVTQAVFAASLDFFMWRFSQRIYGVEGSAARTTLALTVLSPWQWYCSTRTLSNSLEAAFTAAALFFWPWHWISGRTSHDRLDGDRLRTGNSSISPLSGLGEVARLRASLLLAAVASILRPTNVLIWLPLSLESLRKASAAERRSLIIEAIRCGALVAFITTLLDRWYYGLWTFPPLRFLHFNITKSLAVFYGANRPDYYLTEGFPLLLMAALPFGLIGLYQSIASSIRRSSSSQQRDSSKNIRHSLAWIVVFVVSSLSFISHKEARFLYPLLSPLLAITALPLSNFLRHLPAYKYVLILAVLVFNVGISLYTSRTHQRGVVDVLDYLRSQHELRLANNNTDNPTTVAFLMPCHSTPWRSHLIYPEIDAWALTCEPPLDVPLVARNTYLDEADRFYLRPLVWLKEHMENIKLQFPKGLYPSSADHKTALDKQSRDIDGRVTGKGRVWPQYLVVFAALEPALKVFLKNAPYRECWRGFNTHEHDDRRRVGDVVVWCLK